MASPHFSPRFMFRVALTGRQRKIDAKRDAGHRTDYVERGVGAQPLSAFPHLQVGALLR